MNGEEYEVDEVEEEEEVEKCAKEEQSPGETVTDQACSGVEDLSLAEQQDEEKGEKGNEEEEGNQDDQKMPQGTRFCHTPAPSYLLQCHLIRNYFKCFQDLALKCLPPKLSRIGFRLLSFLSTVSNQIETFTTNARQA